MEAFKILGSAIKFGEEHPKKVTDELMKEIVSLLSSYFDVYGNFVYVEDYTNFHNGVNKLLMYIAGLIQFEQKESLCEKINSEELLRNLVNVYLDFYNSYTIVPDKSLAIDIQKRGYSKGLKQYYRNGNLIEIPYDLSEFINLLKENNISIDEQRHILSLIEEKAHEKHEVELQGFYLSGESEIVLAGNKFLDNAKSYQEMYSVNVIFLKDINNESYFNSDLNKIDNSIQKRVTSLLSKINVVNKRNFRKFI